MTKILACGDEGTVEPLIKDTLNKGHLCIKDTSVLRTLSDAPTYIVAIHFSSKERTTSL